MRYPTKLLIALLLLPFLSHAQYYTNQNKIWAFGGNAGLDFNSGTPVAITTSIGTNEGCASVCNATGNLLFYTNGTNVYNRAGIIMPNGASIVPFDTYSTEQAAVIAQVIGNPDQYYLFSLESTGASVGNGKLVYCIVDMTLEGGMGDVIATTKNTTVGDSLGEGMVSVTGNDNNIWLITHRRDTGLFSVFSITLSGVGSETISSCEDNAGIFCYSLNRLKVSPNRQKVASALVNDYGLCHGLELSDFDPATGMVSNCLTIDTLKDIFGVEFSPDNSKLYTLRNNNYHPVIDQYDISLSTISDIRASRIQVADSACIGDLRLAPNGKIYFGAVENYMSCISQPNNAGVACDYMHNNIALVPGTFIQQALPSLFVTTDLSNNLNVNQVVSKDNVSIFPNPVLNELTIKYAANCDFTIFNLLGQKMLGGHLVDNAQIVNMDQLPNAIYLIQITTPDGLRRSLRLFKE